MASNIFAWSIGHDYPYPFDYNLAFYVTGVVCDSRIGVLLLHVRLYGSDGHSSR